jgi:hypothetical protein
MGEVAQGQVFLRAVLFIAVSAIPTLLLSVRLLTCKQTVLALIPGEFWTEEYFHFTFRREGVKFTQTCTQHYSQH